MPASHTGAACDRPNDLPLQDFEQTRGRRERWVYKAEETKRKRSVAFDFLVALLLNEVNWNLAYTIGFHPWEDAASDPPFVEKLTELLEREERGRQPPYGLALDLGTGSGIWGVELAKRGWQVTGVDIVESALHRARSRVEQAGVDMRLVHSDLTSLRETAIGSNYRLILDTGTFHDLADDQRFAMGQTVSVLAAPEATLLLLVWPRRRRPLIRGAERSEIEAAFPGWKITDVEPSHFRLPKLMQMIMRPDEQWYRLRRE